MALTCQRAGEQLPEEVGSGVSGPAASMTRPTGVSPEEGARSQVRSETCASTMEKVVEATGCAIQMRY